MEKLPLNYFKNLFDSTASRAQSGAKDGFWRVIANANSVNTGRFRLKAEK
ncbi:MAG TPA: hypothetical protein PKY59_09660 [Pyrinomonadaceae bacterium]|nr:hypothetical protein [Pyrinomonadaceae bacterium]